MNHKTFRNAISKQCGFTPNKAKHRQDLQVKLSPGRLAHLESICQHHPNKAKPYALQVCNAGEMPDPLPTSFSDWLAINKDSIDLGGNWTPDKVQANHDQYDERPFDGEDAEEWMRRSEQQGENL